VLATRTSSAASISRRKIARSFWLSRFMRAPQMRPRSAFAQLKNRLASYSHVLQLTPSPAQEGSHNQAGVPTFKTT
jgi:hypothetical protein